MNFNIKIDKNLLKFNESNYNNIISNKYLENIHNKLKKFEFIDIDINKYIIYIRKKQLSGHSLSYLYLKDEINIINKKNFIVWYNTNSNKVSNLIYNINFNKYYDDDFLECINIYKNPFLSFEIEEYIQNNIKYKYYYKDSNLNITLFSKNKIEDKLISDIHNVIKFITIIFDISIKINLIIFMTPFKKILNNNFTPHEINTGSTIRGNIIILWRFEELIKVLIHELIHYLNLDLNSDVIIVNKLIKKINIDKYSELRPNEAYTETIAILLYTYYNLLKINNNKFDINLYNELFKHEVIWSYYQCSKIIKHFKCFNKFEDLLDTTKNCKIKQYTSVFSYYIIKTSFIYDINKFCDFLNSINQNTFNFNDSRDNYNKFYNFIIRCLKNEFFSKIINENINYFDKLVINESMRMSII
tara:strand:- start:1186 stop:2430 length:1245 start_codon:yes stop_codon:yes gene_type:complete